MAKAKTFFCWKTRLDAIYSCAYCGGTLSIFGVIYYFCSITIRNAGSAQTSQEKALFVLWFGMLFLYTVYLFGVLIMLTGIQMNKPKLLFYYIVYILVFEGVDVVILIYVVALYKFDSFETIIDTVFFILKLFFHIGVTLIVYSQYRHMLKDIQTKKAMREADTKRKLAREAAGKLRAGEVKDKSAALEVVSTYTSDIVFVDEFVSYLGMNRLMEVVEQDAYNPIFRLTDIVSDYRDRENLVLLLTAFTEIMDHSFSSLSWDMCTPLFIKKVVGFVQEGMNIDVRILGKSMVILENIFLESDVGSLTVAKELSFPDLVSLLPNIVDVDAKESCARLMNAFLFRFPDILMKTVYNTKNPSIHSTRNDDISLRDERKHVKPEADDRHFPKRGKEDAILLVEMSSDATPSTSGLTNSYSFVSEEEV